MTRDESTAIKGPLCWLIMMLIIAAAIMLGGCDEHHPNKRHCNLLYARGHAQPCRP